jgi:hypothetical protein
MNSILPFTNIQKIKEKSMGRSVHGITHNEWRYKIVGDFGATNLSTDMNHASE